MLREASLMPKAKPSTKKRESIAQMLCMKGTRSIMRPETAIVAAELSKTFTFS